MTLNRELLTGFTSSLNLSSSASLSKEFKVSFNSRWLGALCENSNLLWILPAFGDSYVCVAPTFIVGCRRGINPRVTILTLVIPAVF